MKVTLKDGSYHDVDSRFWNQKDKIILQN
jgi:hypothetical protein